MVTLYLPSQLAYVAPATLRVSQITSGTPCSFLGMLTKALEGKLKLKIGILKDTKKTKFTQFFIHGRHHFVFYMAKMLGRTI